MADAKPVKRLTESVPGRMAGWLLALVWVYSLSGVDSHAFSAFPVCVGMLAALVLVLVGLCLGQRVVRMSALGWFSLAAGGYFLCRCLNSYALVESWGESTLIVGAAVYYVAGVYAAQNRQYTSLFLVLGGALGLSLVAWWCAKQPWFCLEWTGRAAYTPEGVNSRPMALLIYKNFAGFFFIAGGVALVTWALWTLRGGKRILFFLLGALAVGLSFFCRTRAPYFLTPIVLVCLWVFDLLLRLHTGRRVGALSYIIGAVLLALILIGVYDLFFGRTLSGFFDGVDSHMRYEIWAAVCEMIPRASWFGLGAGAVEWESIPLINSWSLPNYAHNEYLQVWADYGLVGLLLMLSVIVLHVVKGLRCVASEQVSEQRRALASVAILLIVFSSAYATSDFPWHSFGLTAMCAFACGVLASPFPYVRDAHKWSSATHASIVPVCAQKKGGVLVLALFVIGICTWCVVMGKKFYPVWCGQWEYNRLSTSGEDEYACQRREMIARLLPEYPDSALMDVYCLLPKYEPDWQEYEHLLKIALDANPKQLFSVTVLVDILGQQKKYAEAEQLMREKYVGDAMRGTCLNNWPAYYALNLMLWAREDMAKQQNGLALSKMQYALAIHQWRRVNFDLLHRSGNGPWRKPRGIKPWLQDLILGCQRDVRLLTLLQVQPDDSWRQPMKPGGRGALYSSVVDKSLKK